MATRNTSKPPSTSGKRGVSAQNALKEALSPEQPVFPYPKDLRKDHQPYWLQAVNAKTGDYWNNGDIPLIRLYCRCAHDISRLDIEIEREGDVVDNARGNEVVNPKIMVRAFAENRFMTLSTKLHLQPAARVGTGVEEHQAKKKNNALAAAKTIDEDGDGLLAGGDESYGTHASMQ